MAAQTALTETAEELYKKLLEIVQSKVYSNGGSWYSRTGEFGNAWKFEPAALNGMVLQAIVEYDPSVVGWNPSLFQHGNEFEAATAYGADILPYVWNEGESTGYHGFAPIPATGFWDEFQNYVNGNFDNIFATKCRAMGLSII